MDNRLTNKSFVYRVGQRVFVHSRSCFSHPSIAVDALASSLVQGIFLDSAVSEFNNQSSNLSYLTLPTTIIFLNSNVESPIIFP